MGLLIHSLCVCSIATHGVCLESNSLRHKPCYEACFLISCWWYMIIHLTFCSAKQHMMAASAMWPGTGAVNEKLPPAAYQQTCSVTANKHLMATSSIHPWRARLN